MSSFVSSSIGKKFFMSITGFFLMMFLLVHLSVNMLLLFDDSGDLFNHGAHFMATNPLIKIVEPILALGFLLHILYATYLTLQNQKARPVSYKKTEPGNSSSWASRNMFVLGTLVLIFLVLHIMNFYWRLKVANDVPSIMVDGVEMENAYQMVAGLFKTSLVYDLIYIAGAIFLGIHLTHGFWSAFQTMGWSGNIWRKRLEFVGKLFAIVIAVGFSVIPIYFLIKF